MLHKRWLTEPWTLELYAGQPPYLPGVGWLRKGNLTHCERCTVALTCLVYGRYDERAYCCACARELYRCASSGEWMAA